MPLHRWPILSPDSPFSEHMGTTFEVLSPLVLWVVNGHFRKTYLQGRYQGICAPYNIYIYILYIIYIYIILYGLCYSTSIYLYGYSSSILNSWNSQIELIKMVPKPSIWLIIGIILNHHILVGLYHPFICFYGDFGAIHWSSEATSIRVTHLGLVQGPWQRRPNGRVESHGDVGAHAR